MISKGNVELAKECRRQEESCLWTSTILFIWLERHQTIKAWVTVIPILLASTPGVITVLKLLSSEAVTKLDVVGAVLAFIAGMTPLIYNALKLDEHIERCRRLSGEYKNLQDRFRQAALVSINKPFKEFEEEVRLLLTRLEQAREVGLATPQWCYDKARIKIEAGHYSFEVDQAKIQNQPTTAQTVQVSTASPDLPLGE